MNQYWCASVYVMWAWSIQTGGSSSAYIKVVIVTTVITVCCCGLRLDKNKTVEVYGVPHFTAQSLINAASRFVAIDDQLLL